MTVSAFSELVSIDGSHIQRSAIVDPAVFVAEMDAIFARTWVVVAHESHLATPGSWIASRVGDIPVLVSRSTDGSLHCVVNSCSHRGSKVCRAESGTGGSWTCDNHGWTFGLDGRCLGIPRMSAGYNESDKAGAGLVAASQVEVRHGLVFATFANPDDGSSPSLDEPLGDTGRYLETIFDRYEHGLRVLPGTMRAEIGCNWKLAMENLGTDLQHPEFAHASFMDIWPDPVVEFLEAVEQVITDAGHPACLSRRPPPYTEAELVLGSLTDRAEQREVADWFERTNRHAVDVLGEERANMYVFTGSVFPNLSFLPGISAVFLLHPSTATSTQWWTWCVVPNDAPQAVIDMRRRLFMLSAGPGGLILAEDGENWAEMTAMSSGALRQRLPFRADRGIGETYRSETLPGVFAPMRSEHAQRGFWLRWRRAMAQFETSGQT